MSAAYVYMVECADGSFYTGWTTDVEHRVKVHNSGNGAKYTKARRPVRLVYSQECASKQDAMRREYEIKQLSRAHKEELIKR